MFKVTVQLVGDNRPEDVRAVHELFKLALRTKIGHDAIRSFMTTTLSEMWTTHSGSHRPDQSCGSRCRTKPFMLWLDPMGKSYFLNMCVYDKWVGDRKNICMSARYFPLNTLRDRTAYSLAGHLIKIGAREKIDRLEIPAVLKSDLKEACKLH